MRRGSRPQRTSGKARPRRMPPLLQPGRDVGVVGVRRRRFNLRRNPPQRGPCRKLLSLVSPERLRLSALTNFVDTPPRRSWDRRGASLPFA